MLFIFTCDIVIGGECCKCLSNVEFVHFPAVGCPPLSHDVLAVLGSGAGRAGSVVLDGGVGRSGGRTPAPRETAATSTGSIRRTINCGSDGGEPH